MEMIYADEKETYSIDFRSKTLLEELTRLKKSFKRVKHNTDSYFRKFLFLDERQAKQHLLGFMMPVVTPFPLCINYPIRHSLAILPANRVMWKISPRSPTNVPRI
ncbi:hypothetical protein TNCT_316171 [Trichonephila clavata]|nr:hypothetical protein TNCT_316171 [Trichonephila clavata]